MPIELTPTGEIVTMECLLRTPNVCLYPEGAGPVLLYKDDKRRLWNVCKACAEHAFLVGEWNRTGETPSGNEFVSQYELIKDHYEKLGEIITTRVSNSLFKAGLRANSISYRVKTIESLQQKISRKQHVEELTDIQDLLGVRIVTSFADDVEKVGQLIEQEFDVLFTLSVSKLDYQQEDVFGYPSPHYVVRVARESSMLPEFKLISNLKAELQVRSVLQQAWAELAHEFYYQRETELPSNMKRQFYRLAALFELADQEFVEFRNKASERTASDKI
jgi:putative GTP pyrophosphokinase